MKIVIVLLCCVVGVESYELYRQAIYAGHVIEAVSAAGDLSNASLLSVVHHDIAEKRYDTAQDRIDRVVRSTIGRYNTKKNELHFVLPGETESIARIRKEYPEVAEAAGLRD